MKIILLVLLCFPVLSLFADYKGFMMQDNLFEHHGSIMLLIDPDTGQIIAANKAARLFYGYEDIHSHTITSINQLSAEQVQQKIQNAKVHGLNYFHFEHIRADSSIRQVDVYSYPVEIDGKTLLYSVIHDVSDRVAAEKGVQLRNSILFGMALLFICSVVLIAIKYRSTAQKLQESKLFFSKLFYGNPNATILSDLRTGNFIDLNPVAETFLGYSKTELLGKSATELQIWKNTEDRELLVHRIRNQGLVSGFPAILVSQNGQEIEVLISADKVQLQDRDCMISVVTDLSELQREKRTLLTEVHHRIKNNMYTLSNILSLQAINSRNIETRQSLDAAVQRIISMSVLYDKLYQSAYSGKILLDEYVRKLAIEILDVSAPESSIKLHFEIEEILIQAEKLSAIGIILNELMVNSVKHAFADVPHPTIVIQAHLRGTEIELIISDNGIGFNQDQRYSGFGRELLELSALQLKADMEIQTEAGTRVSLRFSVY